MCPTVWPCAHGVHPLLGQPADVLMRIPDQLLECVAFLCVQVGEEAAPRFQYKGTGFFVAVTNEDRPDRHHVYFVTARHCLTLARHAGTTLYIRVNRKDGGASHVQVGPAATWIYPEDVSIDLAVLAWAPDHRVFDYKYVELGLILDAETLTANGVGAGDDLVVIGLFTQRHGKQRNLP